MGLMTAAVALPFLMAAVCAALAGRLGRATGVLAALAFVPALLLASRTGGEVAEARAEDRNAPRQRYVMALCTPADPYGRAQAEIAN